jgi:apolipoprotein N-acyltransferase
LDDWLHSRMAILRGVENGFSVVRNARMGRMTISDYRGEIFSESSSANGKESYLIGKIPWSTKVSTIYSFAGDWFGVLNIFLATCLIILIFRKGANHSH